MSIITLITDFGNKDHFVAKIKGDIYSNYNEAKIVDVKCVADVLKGSGCWSSNTEFIKYSDLIDFLRANKNHFEKSENFSLSLNKAAAFEFIKVAVEKYPDQEWASL